MIRKIISKIKLSRKQKTSNPIKFSSKNLDSRVKQAADYIGKDFRRALVKLSER